MVEPTKVKPRFFRSLLSASDSAVWLGACCRLLAVADDAFIAHERVQLPLVVAGNFLRVEVVECRAIILALPENGVPTKPGLRALEHQEFEQDAIIVLRDAPFAIVIEHGETVLCPTATDCFL